MSTKNSLELAASDEVCASCGIAAVDDITLKECDGGCDLVKYCNGGCQELHRPEHIGMCKKRKAELHDKQLFTQPDSSHFGECPLCYLPLPLQPKKSILMPCCCKVICNGCSYANKKREKEAGLEQRCAFCREPLSKSQEQSNKIIMERIKKNDPVALTEMGKRNHKKGDYGKAFENYAKAAELGDVAAHFLLGAMYYKGDGVEKDMKRAVYHFEHAAIDGHSEARGLLADYERSNGRFERAVKHLIIGANLGHDNSLKRIKHLFVKGIVSKEDYAAALRAHQTAVDATKSAEREAAEAFLKAREEARRN
jgi:tetratricopeptide (TPR) repeat protein